MQIYPSYEDLEIKFDNLIILNQVRYQMDFLDQSHIYYLYGVYKDKQLILY